MTTDNELLRRYAGQQSESAFTELVERHLNLVYSAALRETGGDAPQAEDLSQAVFTELARKAADLTRHPALAGWLYTCVRHLAANHRRADARRRQREESAPMNEVPSSEAPEAAWGQIRPLLDDTMHELGETDRAAVVLRFFEDRSLKEIGQSLGLSENAARMRVDRALEKLRALLARRGVNSTASGLAAALAVGAVLPAPSALAGSIAAATLASAAAAASNAASSVPLILMTKLKVGLVAVAIVAAVATPAWQQTRIKQLRQENTRLTDRVATLEPLRQDAPEPRPASPEATALAESRAEVSRLRTELARLRGSAGEAIRKKAENTQLRNELAQREAEDATNEINGAMGGLMKNAMAQQVQSRLARMKEKLGLSGDQAKAIEELLLAQVHRQSALTQKLLAGKKVSADDLAKAGGAGAQQRIEDLLSPEQTSLYQDFLKEESVANARLAADSEMLQLQLTVNLSAEQKDKVRAALYEETLKQLNGEGSRETPAAGASLSASMSDTMSATFTRKLKALEPLLTTEQLDKYRQFQETQLKYIKNVSSLLPKP